MNADRAVFARVIVYVADPAACAAFYSTHFGSSRIAADTPDWIELDGGGCRLAFHQAYEDGIARQAATGSAHNPHKLVFRVPNVAAWRDRLAAAGVQVGPVQSFPGGWQVCQGRDCEGHVFQLSDR